MKKIAVAVAIISLVICALALSLSPARYSGGAGVAAEAQSGENEPAAFGARDAGGAVITYNNFLYPSGALLQEYIVEIDPAFRDGNGHSATDVLNTLKRLFEDKQYRVSFDETGRIHGARHFASYTDYYVYYSLTGDERSESPAVREEGLWERKIYSTRQTVFAKIASDAYLNEIAAAYFADYPPPQKENMKFVYNYGTKYDNVYAVDANAHYRQNGMNVYSWDFNAANASQEITTVNVTPNKSAWYGAAILATLLFTAAALVGCYWFQKRKKGERE